MHIYTIKLYIKNLNKRLIHTTTSVKKAIIIYRECQDALFKYKEKLIQEQLEH